MMKSSLYDRAANPSEVAKAYSIVRTNPKEGTTYLNLGYWRDHPPNHRSAAAAMAKLLAEEAGFQPGDVILDAGFGFGDWR